MLRNWHGKVAGAGLLAAGWLAAHALPTLVAQSTAAKPSDDKKIVAMVNGVPITRDELLEDLFARRGREHLQLLINRRIFEQAAQQAGVVLTEAELDAELQDMVAAAKCASLAEFEREVLRPRGISLAEYKEDKVRVTLIARKIAQSQITVSPGDIKQAFEARHGDRVQCRVIVDKDQRLMTQIWSDVRSDPEAFVLRAREQRNPDLAAVGGRINPVSRVGLAYRDLEDALFKMKDGEVSEVLQIPEGHVIALRERLIPADKSVTLESVQEELRRLVVEQKLREELPRVFKELREKAVVQDFLNKKFDLKSVVENWAQGSKP